MIACSFLELLREGFPIIFPIRPGTGAEPRDQMVSLFSPSIPFNKWFPKKINSIIFADSRARDVFFFESGWF